MKEILKYQDLDFKIKKIETEITGSEDRKNASRMQTALRSLQERLLGLNKLASEVNERYKVAEKSLDEAASKLDLFSKKVATVKGVKIDEALETGKALADGTNILEREISALVKQAEDICREIENVMKNARIAKKNLIVYKENYDKLRSGFEDELNQLKAELALQESKVDKKLLTKYHAKQSGKNTQVFVPLKDDRCGGCRMEIPAAGLSKLDKNKFMECESCGRIVFVED